MSEERGDEVPYRPWWLTEEGMARMRELETELDELEEDWNEYERSLQSH